MKINFTVIALVCVFSQSVSAQWLYNSSPNPASTYYTGGKVGIGMTTPNFLLDIMTPTAQFDGIQLLNGSTGKWVRFMSQNLGVQAYNDITVAGDAGIVFGSMAGINTVDYGFVIVPHRGAKNGLRITPAGDVAIGTSTADARLTVKGNIHAQEVKVDLAGSVAPDYVFETDYALLSLKDIARYVQENKHLPEIPSAKEMENNGINLREMNLLLLKKVEELTLHMIEQQKNIEKQNALIDEQGKAIKDLHRRVK